MCHIRTSSLCDIIQIQEQKNSDELHVSSFRLTGIIERTLSSTLEPLFDMNAYTGTGDP